ncbi:MAG: NUDIX domain-containing protein [Bacilli bacterium]
MIKWDLYDDKFNLINEVVNEDEEINDGKYHCSINTYIINSDKKLLLVKRTMNYNFRYPGFWNSINGNVENGKNSVETVIESIDKKIGINIKTFEITSIDVQLRDPYHYIYETFIIKKNICLDDIVFKDKTCTQAKWVDLKELYNMISNGEIAWVMIPRIEKYVIPYLK